MRFSNLHETSLTKEIKLFNSNTENFVTERCLRLRKHMTSIIKNIQLLKIQEMGLKIYKNCKKIQNILMDKGG